MNFGTSIKWILTCCLILISISGCVGTETKGQIIQAGGIDYRYKPPKFDPQKSITYKKTYDELKKNLFYGKVSVSNEGYRTIKIIRDKERLIEIIKEFDKLKSKVPEERYMAPGEQDSYMVQIILWEGSNGSYIVLQANNNFYYKQSDHLLLRTMPDNLIDLLDLKEEKSVK